MSTLPLNAPRVPAFPTTGFSRVVAVVLNVLDAMSEAKEMARAAHKKYPFVSL